MAQINKSSDYFNTVLYTGNGSTQSISGVNFSPDFVWIKARNDAQEHNLYDSVRGATKGLQSDGTGAEYTLATSLTSFDSDGFSIGSFGGINGSSDTEVAWNWLAGGTASSNTDGSITSNVSANTTSGFSIVSWTGSGASDTVGHGLSSAPELVIVKNRTDSATDWRIGNSVVPTRTFADGNGYYLEFDTGAIANPGSQTIWGSPPANPTTSVFKVGSNNSNNGSGDSMIAYCFHSVKGFSKIGSYTGNGSTDGTFVFTGMRPSFVLAKRTNSASGWVLFDTAREPFNLADTSIRADDSGAENESNGALDILSNGFKWRTTDTGVNGSGDTYIYIAFAENPLVGTNNIPATAR